MAKYALLSNFIKVCYGKLIMETVPGQNLVALAINIRAIVDQLLPITVALALLFFIWNIARFILRSGKGGDTTKEGLGMMAWGIVALFVMVSIWGIVGFMGQIFGIGQGGTMAVPGLSQ